MKARSYKALGSVSVPASGSTPSQLDAAGPIPGRAGVVISNTGAYDVYIVPVDVGNAAPTSSTLLATDGWLLKVSPGATAELKCSKSVRIYGVADAATTINMFEFVGDE